MSERERRRFLRLWGQRKPDNTVKEDNGKRLKRMKEEVAEKRGAVDHRVAAYVDANRELAIEQTRSEYRPLANRNWKTIQKFGVRLIRGLVALTVILLLLGWKTLNTTDEIQSGRRNAIVEKCHAGQAAVVKLRSEIKNIPDEAERIKAEAQEKATEELLETVTGHVNLQDPDCHEALEQAGLK